MIRNAIANAARPAFQAVRHRTRATTFICRLNASPEDSYYSFCWLPSSCPEGTQHVIEFKIISLTIFNSFQPSMEGCTLSVYPWLLRETFHEPLSYRSPSSPVTVSETKLQTQSRRSLTTSMHLSNGSNTMSRACPLKERISSSRLWRV